MCIYLDGARTDAQCKFTVCDTCRCGCVREKVCVCERERVCVCVDLDGARMDAQCKSTDCVMQISSDE